MRFKRGALIGLIAAEAWGWLHHLGRTWGSTCEERRRYLPGDDLVKDPRLVTNHATTIEASAEDIWPWLVQMGWNRGGWYTYRWVDRFLFPENPRSADSILPEYQDLKVGDRIPDGPPEADCFYEVELLEPNKLLVLRSWTISPRSCAAMAATGWSGRGPSTSMRWPSTRPTSSFECAGISPRFGCGSFTTRR